MQIGTPQEERPELIIPSRLEAIEREQWSLAKRTCAYQRAYLSAPPPCLRPFRKWMGSCAEALGRVYIFLAERQVPERRRLRCT